VTKEESLAKTDMPPALPSIALGQVATILAVGLCCHPLKLHDDFFERLKTVNPYLWNPASRISKCGPKPRVRQSRLRPPVVTIRAQLLAYGLTVFAVARHPESDWAPARCNSLQQSTVKTLAERRFESFNLANQFSDIIGRIGLGF